MTVEYAWRGRFTNEDLDALHAEAFGYARASLERQSQVERHSLGWVCARDDDRRLIGFVNVPWDGASHAFIVDTIVADRARHQGIGTRLIAGAADGARAAVCEWLHVDFEADLASFYLDACGFRPTAAGLIRL